MPDPAAPARVAALLRSHNIRPQKRLGQNFLCDRNTVRRIVRAVRAAPGAAVLEIGGGLGIVTLALADAGARVTTVEVDHAVAGILRELTVSREAIRVVEGDFLRLNHAALFDEAFGERAGVVVGSLPYAITTPIIERLLEHKARICRAVLVVQREFAERMLAKPGSRTCGALSLFVQYHARARSDGTVPPTVFWPRPEVTSEIVVLEPALDGTVAVHDETRFFALIRAAFGQRRKTLLNSLARAPASYGLGFTVDSRDVVLQLLTRARIDPMRRGETLSLEEFARLAEESMKVVP